MSHNTDEKEDAVDINKDNDLDIEMVDNNAIFNNIKVCHKRYNEINDASNNNDQRHGQIKKSFQQILTQLSQLHDVFGTLSDCDWDDNSVNCLHNIYIYIRITFFTKKINQIGKGI